MKLDRAFQRELRALVSIINTLSNDMTWVELASRAGVSTSCVRNLCYGETKSPHFRTIYRICRAIGLDIKFEKKKIKLRMAA